MDDHSFDELVRSRLKNHVDSGEDPDFGSLKGRLSAIKPKSDLRRLIYGSLAAMLVLTGFNIYLTFYYPAQEHAYATTTKVDSLVNVINVLKNGLKEEYSRTETIKQSPVPAVRSSVKSNASESSFVFKGESDSRPTTLYSRIEKHSLFSSLRPLLVPVTMPSVKFVVVKQPVQQPEKLWRRREISAKIKSQIEQHYSNGIGINLAPQVYAGGMSLEKTVSPIGGLGFAADWIVSPHLSIETNARYSFTNHLINKSEQQYTSLNDKYYGTPSEIRQSENLVSGSVLFGYRQWLTHRDQVNVKIGVSRYEAFGGRYNIKYFQGNYHDADDYGAISQVHKIEGIRFFANTLTLSLGLSRQVGKNQMLELNGFYEYGLGKSSMDLWGVRSSLWFKVR